MLDEGCLDFEVFISIKGKIFFTKSVLLKEIDRTVVSGWIMNGVP